MKNRKSTLQIISKSKDKLKTARIDFENGQYDDSVSRAYYAVFHMMSAALFTADEVYSSHSQTIGAFNKKFIKTGTFPKQFSRIIQDLFDDRQTGDYDAAARIDKGTARQRIRDAENLTSRVEEYILETIGREGKDG